MIYYDIAGYVAIAFSVIAFLSRSKKGMRLYGMISATLFAISIYGYQGYNGVFVSVISVTTKLLSLKYKEEKLQTLRALGVVAAISFYFLINNEGLYGILPAISLIFVTTADIQKDIIKMKKLYYGSATAWLIYAILLNSIPAIIYDIVGIIILTYSIKTLQKNKVR